MKSILKRAGGCMLIALLTVCAGLFFDCGFVFAEGFGLTLAPMNQSIVVEPGTTRKVSFLVANPSSASQDVSYELSVEPFYLSEKGDIYYEAEGNSGEMAGWVTFDIPTTGKLAPNEQKAIPFSVNVPKDAPAGGQYIAIIITLNSGDDAFEEEERKPTNDSGVSIKEVKRMAHLVYAEVTGETIKRGEILDVSLPSFLFSGNIAGTSTVKNTGNVHGTAKYTLQVFPLFSDEEVFSNIEEPDEKKVLPDRSVYRETVWDKTPSIGIFNVVYRVEFEGSVAEVSKMVIICPLWLLFVILFAIILIITWLVVKVKSRKKSSRSE